jgi:hypothetical protein
MANHEQSQYDPYIPAGGAGGQQGAQGQNGNVRTAALQAVCLRRLPTYIAESCSLSSQTRRRLYVAAGLSFTSVAQLYNSERRISDVPKATQPLGDCDSASALRMRFPITISA